MLPRDSIKQIAQALRQKDRGEEIDVEDVQPVHVGHLQAGDLAAVGMLRARSQHC